MAFVSCLHRIQKGERSGYLIIPGFRWLIRDIRRGMKHPYIYIDIVTPNNIEKLLFAVLKLT